MLLPLASDYENTMLNYSKPALADRESTETIGLPPKKPSVAERLISITYANANGTRQTAWVRESRMPNFLASSFVPYYG